MNDDILTQLTNDIAFRLRLQAKVSNLYEIHHPHMVRVPTIYEEAADEIERLRTLLNNVEADRDRWQKIAMFNLRAIYGDQTQHHIDTCYEADGTYHGGAHGDR